MASKQVTSALDYLAYLAVRVAVCVVQAMSLEASARLAKTLATLCCHVLKIRGDVVEDNLKHAFPQLSSEQRDQLAWRMWEHLFLFLVEVVHAPRKIHRTNWRDFVQLENAEQIVRAAFDDRPTVMVCGHYGNFEVSGYLLALLGFPTYTVARTLDNPYLDRYLNKFRELGGQFILAKVGSAQQVEEVLRRGGVLALLGDQYAGPKGCWVEFFGRPASSHKAIALFTLGSEATTLFCYTRRLGRVLYQQLGCSGGIDPSTMPAEMGNVTAITQWYTQLLEDTIRKAPEQYWWVHRRWKDGRTPRTAAKKKAA